MKFSTTAVFSLLFVVVVAFYVQFESPIQTLKNIPMPGRMSHRLLLLETQDFVKKIQIGWAQKKEDMTLERKGSDWMITQPLHYAADPVMARGLASALEVSLKIRRLMPEKGWADYGLERPHLKLGVQTEKGQGGMRFLLFGDRSPIGDFLFARWEGEKEYFLLPAELEKIFDRTVYSLREKRIFRKNLNDAAKVRVQVSPPSHAPSDTYELERHGEIWYWMEPVSILGETVTKEKMAEVLGLFKGLYIKEFLDRERKRPGELGISEASSFLSVTGKTEGETEVLEIGKAANAKDAFYAKRRDEGVVFLVAKGNLDKIFERLQSFVREAKKSNEPASPAPAREDSAVEAEDW